MPNASHLLTKPFAALRSQNTLSHTGRRKACAVALALAALPWASAQAADIQLRLLETTDIHMNLLAYDYYQDKATDNFGLAKTAALINAARGEAPNSLLFDNGDLLQGNPMGDVLARIEPLKPGQDHPAYRVLRSLKIDAANLGNHEFNFGLPFLKQAMSTAKFPIISANVMQGTDTSDKAKPAFTPYVILKRNLVDTHGKKHTVKVGVLGLLPPQIMAWDKTNLEGKVTTRDIVETAQRFVPKMRAAGADVVVILAHSGFEKGDVPRFAENSVSRLVDVPGVDAVMFGHAHAEFPSKSFAEYPRVNVEAGTINGIPAVMPGRWGDHLGIIDLTLSNTSGSWKVANAKTHIRPIYDKANKKPLAESDPAVVQLVDAEHQATLRYVRGTVAQTKAPITSYFALVADDPSVQIVSQAQLAYARRALQGTEYEKLPLLSAAAPFKVGGRQGWSYFTDIPAGALSIRHVADLYIYPNTIKAVKISGSTVREWLEMSAGQFKQIDPKGPAEQNLIDDSFPSYNYDAIDGVTYQIDVTQAPRYDAKGVLKNADAHRIVNLQFNGQPIDDTASFVVVTNNYRAFGGGNFPGLDGKNVIMDAPDENREALVQYMRQQQSLDPSADNNWSIQDVAGVKLRFASSSTAAGHLARYPGIKLVKDNGDGSALFELAGK